MSDTFSKGAAVRFWTLGTSAAVATLGRDNLSLLVRSQNELFLIECSGSPINRLLKVKYDFRDLNLLIITHRHTDHIYGLPSLVHALKIRGGHHLPMPIFAPPETIEVASKLLLSFWDRASLSKLVSLIPVPLEENHLLFESSGVQIFTSPVEHGPETLAVKMVEKQTGLSMVYSSDTVPCESVVRLATGVDDLLHDSTFCVGAKGDGRLFGHSTARDAGVVARRSGVKRLILLHFSDVAADGNECVSEAALEFAGQVVAASDFQEFVCGSLKGSSD